MDHLTSGFDPRYLLFSANYCIFISVDREKRWSILYDQARIDVVLKVEAGVVTGFSVNLSYREGEEYHEVIRYDTAHGYVHVHRFWESDEMQRWRSYEGRPLAEAFQAAYDDIKANWERYIELYKRGMRR